MRCSFVADLHLDANTASRNAAFRSFLALESTQCDELYLLGDLTEVWVGDDDDAPFARDLERDLRSASAHCRIFVMHGNRDFLFADEFAARCGAHLIDDPHVIERNGVRLLLCHGDELCTDDAAYQRARTQFRSPAWQRDILRRSIGERRALADTLREQSRAANANKSANIMDVCDDAVVRAARRHRADAIVHGHTHRPGIHRIAGCDRPAVRYVLGDWDRCGWLLRFDRAFSLLRFSLADTTGQLSAAV